MKQTGEAAIIFCNDSAQLVVIGGDESLVKERLGKLQSEHRISLVFNERIDAETYAHRFVWHIKHVEYEVIDG